MAPDAGEPSRRQSSQGRSLRSPTSREALPSAASFTLSLSFSLWLVLLETIPSAPTTLKSTLPPPSLRSSTSSSRLDLDDLEAQLLVRPGVLRGAQFLAELLNRLRQPDLTHRRPLVGNHPVDESSHP
jgi:hypothetical protein